MSLAGWLWFWDAVENASFMPWLLAAWFILAVTESEGCLSLDLASRYWRVLVWPARRVLGAFGRADIRACFCGGSRAGPSYLGVPGADHWRVTAALRAESEAYQDLSRFCIVKQRASFSVTTVALVSTLMILLGTIYPWHTRGDGT